MSYGCTDTRSTKSINEAEANELIDKWLVLWETYDLNRLEDIFWNSPECSYFSSEKEGLITGYNALIPHHKGFGFEEGGKKTTKSLWLEDLNLQMLESTCVVTAIWYFGDKTIPKDSVQHGPVTFVLLRDNNKVVRIGHTQFANY